LTATRIGFEESVPSYCFKSSVVKGSSLGGARSVRSGCILVVFGKKSEKYLKGPLRVLGGLSSMMRESKVGKLTPPIKSNNPMGDTVTV